MCFLDINLVTLQPKKSKTGEVFQELITPDKHTK